MTLISATEPSERVSVLTGRGNWCPPDVPCQPRPDTTQPDFTHCDICGACQGRLAVELGRYQYDRSGTILGPDPFGHPIETSSDVPPYTPGFGALRLGPAAP